MNETIEYSSTKIDAEQFSLGFLTALVSEVVPCERALGDAGWNPEPTNLKLSDAGISRWSKEISKRKVVAHSMAIGRMGQTAAAIETIGFLERCKPHLVFLTGIAGSLREDKILKGDVVVGANIRWRTQNRVFGEEGCDQYRSFNNALNQSGLPSDASRRLQKMLSVNYPMVTRVETDLNSRNVHFGDIFSWDYVVDSKRVVQKINSEFPEALCVEMEAGGFLGALERFRTLRGGRPMRGYVVRGISDYASRKDKQGPVRTACSENAASVAVKIAEWMCAADEMRALRQWAI